MIFFKIGTLSFDDTIGGPPSHHASIYNEQEFASKKILSAHTAIICLEFQNDKSNNLKVEIWPEVLDAHEIMVHGKLVLPKEGAKARCQGEARYFLAVVTED